MKLKQLIKNLSAGNVNLCFVVHEAKDTNVARILFRANNSANACSDEILVHEEFAFLREMPISSWSPIDNTQIRAYINCTKPFIKILNSLSNHAAFQSALVHLVSADGIHDSMIKNTLYDAFFQCVNAYYKDEPLKPIDSLYLQNIKYNNLYHCWEYYISEIA